jgi:hypothetical protein
MPINFNGVALILFNLKTKVISAVQLTINKNKIKTWTEIGAILVTYLRNQILDKDSAD